MYGRSTSNWTPAAVGLTEEDRELVKNLGGVGVRFGGFERESHLSLALRGGREGGRKRERTSKSAQRTTTTAGRWSWREGERARGRTREGGRNGLKNDTQLPLMFRLLSASQATPSDFFKTADGRTDADGDGVEL